MYYGDFSSLVLDRHSHYADFLKSPYPKFFGVESSFYSELTYLTTWISLADPFLIWQTVLHPITLPDICKTFIYFK